MAGQGRFRCLNGLMGFAILVAIARKIGEMIDEQYKKDE
jgi:hypothetical protein